MDSARSALMQVVWLTESEEQTEREDNSSNVLMEDLHHFADHIKHWTSSSGCWEEQLLLHRTNGKIRERSHFQRKTTAPHTHTHLSRLIDGEKYSIRVESRRKFSFNKK